MDASNYPMLALIEQVSPVLNRLCAFLDEAGLVIVEEDALVALGDGEGLAARSFSHHREVLSQALGIDQAVAEEERSQLLSEFM